MRRDQVYFTKKDVKGESELYSLAEFKEGARPVHNLRKRYYVRALWSDPQCGEALAMSKSKGESHPVSKKTLALLDQLQRKRGTRDLKKRILIVCEDGKSAPNTSMR